MARKNAPDPSLLGGIQSEVAAEASPMLTFLLDHARLIALGIVVIIAVVAGVGVWRYMDARAVSAERLEFGKIVTGPVENREKGLTELAAKSSGGVKLSAELALINIADTTRNGTGTAPMWAELAKGQEGPFGFAAALGEAQALASNGKPDEALARLEALLPTSKRGGRIIVEDMIISLAESQGKYDRALAACESIIASADFTGNKELWRQKADYLRRKIAEAKPAAEQPKS